MKLGEEAEQAKILENETKRYRVFLLKGAPKTYYKNRIDGGVNGERSAAAMIEEKHNSTWEQLNNLDVPIRESHKGQTLRALLKMRGINMARDPMAVFFQVFMPVAFAALGIWLGTLSTKRTVETKQLFTLGNI